MDGGPSGMGNSHEEVEGLFRGLALAISGPELAGSECELLAFEGSAPRWWPSCPPSAIKTKSEIGPAPT